MFDTLLIANRGEIACRVIQSARAMGLQTVAVYSQADRDALHVRQADRAVCIGPGPARESYLDIEKILQACRQSGAQAVHPGYGFLSENAAFARALTEAGLVFVGPPAHAIEALGNKSAAKRLAQRIGVPCLPGYEGEEQDIEALVAHAQRVGAPLMIKAAAGGGGRGMRSCDDVTDKAALVALLEAARTEAKSAFGNGDLLLERRVLRARHVEVQIFGDTHGNYVHLGERDCSTQRRNQKVIEEAPAPGVSETLRDQMGQAAIRLAREVGYVGAGTVEFLLADDGSFSFLEMNTRLQVEHPVTEAITGLDLVRWQLEIAAGRRLALSQSEIAFSGHAIEARLCAEDAHAGFIPQIGRVLSWSGPRDPAIRMDHGLSEQPEISPYYDSMVAKVIAFGSDRKEARARLVRALSDTSVLGVRTNRDYLLQCLAAEPFANGRLSTRWLDEHAGVWQAPTPDARWVALAGAIHLMRASRIHGPLARWSSVGRRAVPMRLKVGEVSYALSIDHAAQGPMNIQVATIAAQPDSQATHQPAPQTFRVEVIADEAPQVELVIDGLRLSAKSVPTPEGGWLDALGVCSDYVDLADRAPSQASSSGAGSVISSMHGTLVKLAVAPEQKVQRGEFVLAIEAMKMEHRIEAPVTGTVVEIGAEVGAHISPGRLLVRIEPELE